MASFSEFPEYMLQRNQLPSSENIGLFDAAKAGKLDIVKQHISSGGKPNYFHLPSGQKTSLHTAAEHGHIDIIKFLVENGAVIQVLVGTTKDNCLHLARDVGVVETLIALGCNVNHTNTYGNTPLHEAVHLGLSDIASMLLAHGADPKIANHKGSTPLHFMCYDAVDSNDPSKSVDILKTIVAAGADVSARDNKGMTPLLACCVGGRLDLIAALLALGADAHATDNDGRDAYHISVFYKQEGCYQLFAKDSPQNRYGRGGGGDLSNAPSASTLSMN